MIQGSKKLIDEYPLLVLPSLAKQIGLNEAIMIQQIHFWLQQSRHKKDGRVWIYNTFKDWEIQFPFWSVRTIMRIVASLEKKGLIIKGNYNKLNYDKTIWYTIDYKNLEKAQEPTCQVVTRVSETDMTSCQHREGQVVTTNTIDNTETKREKEERAAAFFENNGFGTISSYMKDKIFDWIDDITEPVVVYAMKIAVENNVRKWSYVNNILVDWKNRGVKSLQDAENLVREFESNKSTKGKGQIDWEGL